MKNSTNKLFLFVLLVAFSFQNLGAQNEDEPKQKQIKIVTKTIDENGKETVTETVKSGGEMSEEDIDKLIQEAIGDEKEIDVEVNMEEDGKTKIRIVEQKVEMDKKEGGEEKKVMIFKSDDGEITELNGEEIRIIKKEIGEDGEIEIEMEDVMGEDEMIWIEKDEEGEKGDVIIIEEETTEEMDKDGNVVKKTVKKKKKIVKKDN